MEKLSTFGKKWTGCASLLSVIIAVAALLGVGTFFYNQVWQSKVLTYTLLPSYDLEDQAFSGIVIENRGQVTLTNVQIIVTDLDESIFKLKMPGAHEPVTAISGGEGFKNVTIEMKRFSPGASLPIYMMTDGVINLLEGKTFFISSDQVKATQSSFKDNNLVDIASVIIIVIFIMTSLISFSINFVVDKQKRYVKELSEQVDNLRADTKSIIG